MGYYFLIAFSLISLNLIGQRDYDEGYIITLANDTLQGKIRDREMGFSPRIYNKIRFREDNSRFRKKYSPNQIRDYKAGDRVYESVGIKQVTLFFRVRYFILPAYKKTFLRVKQRGKPSYYTGSTPILIPIPLIIFPCFTWKGEMKW